MAREVVLAEHSEEHPALLVVGVRGLAEDDGVERLHVDDGSGLRLDGFVGGLICGESLVAKAEFLVTSHLVGVCSSLVRGVFVRHGELGSATAPC